MIGININFLGNISPGLNSSENTLNTLRYTERMKQFRNNNKNLMS